MFGRTLLEVFGIAWLSSACLSTPPRPESNTDASSGTPDAIVNADAGDNEDATPTDAAPVDVGIRDAEVVPDAGRPITSGLAITGHDNPIGVNGPGFALGVLNGATGHGLAHVQVGATGTNIMLTTGVSGLPTLGSRLSGIVRWPCWFSSHSTGEQVRVDIETPAFIQITDDWLVTAEDGTTQAMQGRTKYSIHPDGRVIRDEDFDLDSNPNCSQDSGDLQPYLLANVVLNRTLLNEVSWQDTTGPGNVAMPRTGGIDVYARTALVQRQCASGMAGGPFAVTWASTEMRQPEHGCASGLRMWDPGAVNAGTRAFALLTDFARDCSSLESGRSYQLAVLNAFTSTCEAGAELADAWLTPPTMTSATQVTFEARTGLYLVDVPSSGDMTFTPSGRLPSLTARLAGGRIPQSVRIGARVLVPGVDYLLGSVAGHSYLHLTGPISEAFEVHF